MISELYSDEDSSGGDPSDTGTIFSGCIILLNMIDSLSMCSMIATHLPVIQFCMRMKALSCFNLYCEDYDNDVLNHLQYLLWRQNTIK